jgi:hypothetical protein
MKKRYMTVLALAGALSILSAGCKKDTAPADPNAWKYPMVEGEWSQQDLVISVDVKLGGQKIPAGTSMIQLAPLIGQALGDPAVAEALTCTGHNTYRFNKDGTYAIDGCTGLILPVAGNTGSWKLTVYDAVLQLSPAAGTDDPHWINRLTDSTMELALTVTIPGVGDAPLALILKK